MYEHYENTIKRFGRLADFTDWCLQQFRNDPDYLLMVHLREKWGVCLEASGEHPLPFVDRTEPIAALPYPYSAENDLPDWQYIIRFDENSRFLGFVDPYSIINFVCKSEEDDEYWLSAYGDALDAAVDVITDMINDDLSKWSKAGLDAYERWQKRVDAEEAKSEPAPSFASGCSYKDSEADSNNCAKPAIEERQDGITAREELFEGCEADWAFAVLLDKKYLTFKLIRKLNAASYKEHLTAVLSEYYALYPQANRIEVIAFDKGKNAFINAADLGWLWRERFIGANWFDMSNNKQETEPFLEDFGFTLIEN